MISDLKVIQLLSTSLYM